MSWPSSLSEADLMGVIGGWSPASCPFLYKWITRCVIHWEANNYSSKFYYIYDVIKVKKLNFCHQKQMYLTLVSEYQLTKDPLLHFPNLSCSVAASMFPCKKKKKKNKCRLVSNCAPPYFWTKKYIMIHSKLIFFSFKTTGFHQWNTEHVVSQSYLLFSCSIYPILSKI